MKKQLLAGFAIILLTGCEGMYNGAQDSVEPSARHRMQATSVQYDPASSSVSTDANTSSNASSHSGTEQTIVPAQQPAVPGAPPEMDN